MLNSYLRLEIFWPLTPLKMKNISKWNPMILLISYLEKIGYRKADKIVTTLQNSETHINSITNQPKKSRIYLQWSSLILDYT